MPLSALTPAPESISSLFIVFDNFAVKVIKTYFVFPIEIVFLSKANDSVSIVFEVFCILLINRIISTFVNNYLIFNIKILDKRRLLVVYL